MTNHKTTIVNEQDEIIGAKESGTLDENDIYRVSALWIQNLKGDILLAQRSFNKKHHPGKWGPAVAGTIDEGESYESNIIKEAEEEIGLTDCKFEKAFHHFHKGQYKHFTQWFLATVDREVDEFTIEPDEVEQIKWFTRVELKEELKTNPDNFLRGVPKCLELFSWS